MDEEKSQFGQEEEHQSEIDAEINEAIMTLSKRLPIRALQFLVNSGEFTREDLSAYKINDSTIKCLLRSKLLMEGRDIVSLVRDAVDAVFRTPRLVTDENYFDIIDKNMRGELNPLIDEVRKLIHDICG